MQQSLNSVNIHEAQRHLSQIIDDVKRLGTPIIIAKSGKPQVKIVPLDEPVVATRFGFLRDMSPVPDDFDTMYSDEINELFGINK